MRWNALRMIVYAVGSKRPRVERKNQSRTSKDASQATKYTQGVIATKPVVDSAATTLPLEGEVVVITGVLDSFSVSFYGYCILSLICCYFVGSGRAV